MHYFRNGTQFQATVPELFANRVFGGLRNVELVVAGNQTVTVLDQQINVTWFSGLAEHKLNVPARWLKTQVFYFGDDPNFVRQLQTAVGNEIRVVQRQYLGEVPDAGRYLFLVVEARTNPGWPKLVNLLAGQRRGNTRENVFVVLPYISNRMDNQVAINRGALGTLASYYDARQLQVCFQQHQMMLGRF